jgi:hypothetical protein
MKKLLLFMSAIVLSVFFVTVGAQNSVRVNGALAQLTAVTPVYASSLIDKWHVGQALARFLVDGLYNFYGLELLQLDNDASGFWIEIMKSRSTDGVTNAVVQSGDEIGRLLFRADDGGTTYRSAAQIQAAVDGTPGSSDMPGRLVFSTTADGAATTTERLRIDSAGNILFAAKTQANLGTPTNGSVVYCSDCTIANPCAGGGTGALAKRLNGAWVCN